MTRRTAVELERARARHREAIEADATTLPYYIRRVRKLARCTISNLRGADACWRAGLVEHALDHALLAEETARKAFEFAHRASVMCGGDA